MSFAPSSHQPGAGSGSIFGMIWLLHAAFQAPFSFVGLFMTGSLHFVGMNATVAVIVKLYSALSLSLSLTTLLLYTLPDYLPGKRAVAILLLFYHGLASSILLTCEPFTGSSFPTPLEVGGRTVTPEIAVGIAHGLLALGVTAWWQATLPQVKGVNASRKAQ